MCCILCVVIERSAISCCCHVHDVCLQVYGFNTTSRDVARNYTPNKTYVTRPEKRLAATLLELRGDEYEDSGPLPHACAGPSATEDMLAAPATLRARAVDTFGYVLEEPGVSFMLPCWGDIFGSTGL